MKVNWKIRLQNKAFWLSVIPAALLAAQALAAVCGLTWEVSAVQATLLDAVNAVFALLTVLGVVTDPTTAGWADSPRALTYTAPAKEEEP